METLGERRINMKRGLLLTLWLAICTCGLLLSGKAQQPSQQYSAAEPLDHRHLYRGVPVAAFTPGECQEPGVDRSGCQ